MGNFFKVIGLLVLLATSYLLFWPTGLSPQAWVSPVDQGLTGEFVPNTRIKESRLIAIDGKKGPEDIAIGPDGLLYTGVHDGDILRIDPATGASEKFAETGGRPLGLEFDVAGNLIVADSIRGLLSITSAGSVNLLADKADDGSPLGYVDDLDIMPDGTIWFSDASTKFLPNDWGGTKAASVAEIWEGAGTGRVLTYDPVTGAVEIKITGLVFSNGVAVDPQGRFVLVNETGTYSVLKHWLVADKAGQTEVLIDNLPGFPDNINRDSGGGFFLGLVSPRSAEVDSLSEKPFVRNVLWRIPGFREAAVPVPYSHLVRFDENGQILETWQDPAGSYPDITGAVRAADGTVYASSLEADSIAALKP